MQPMRVMVSSPNGEWCEWHNFVRVLCANRADEVADILQEVEKIVQQGGYVGGFVSYESAPVFDSAHLVHKPISSLPLAWFAVSDSPPQPVTLPQPTWHFCGRWRGEINRKTYLQNVAHIQNKIAAGDVYQVNLTYPRRARFAGSPLSFFAGLSLRQPSPWSFFAETEQWAVCCASPECFFQWNNGVLTSRPMKGTRVNRAGAAEQLRNSEKECAENLMIVDMLRNDMSRLSDAKNVRADKLLTIEEYPTVLQMTSQVQCETQSGLHDLFAALFPCASVTGAPKIAAMRYINELEQEARGVYCGACGWAGNKQARFAVAIRTAVVDKTHGIVRYDSGSGIVADSDAAAEWNECESKAAILKTPTPSICPRKNELEPPSLLETIYATPQGAPRLSLHLARLEKSAHYFDIPFNIKSAARLVERQCVQLTAPAILRLRLALGKMVITQHAMTKTDKPLMFLYDEAVNSSDELLQHKTTMRGLYVQAMQAAKNHGCNDAILHNERGEITETCIANIGLDIDGVIITPSLSCGLLHGVMRQALIDSGDIREGILYIDDLRRANKVWRLNSVRGMEEVTIKWED